ncbi:hypothetical protein [Pseudodesulfovibrio sediminis]|uniref:Uncharacterized protein n=1 Tax=Pseudodesulfovibrio sediminis TaxID=2810563 RepID=A0ABM7P2G7_9BACT|nr:hypothetical protein [Pseudodesulfovibrio sediminis]BCS86969.1 hypothetical protein PSDVSF_02110 [Pseudodesulfovibrio sediminis]
MQKTEFQFPEFINELVVDDTLFARAYQNSVDQDRAVLKTCIAGLYDWYGPRKQTAQRSTQVWRSGLESTLHTTPVDCTIILFDASLCSPTRLLAALVPAVACGVRNVLVARIGDEDSPWPEAILTGLELAGLELAVNMTGDQLDELLESVQHGGGTGRVIDFREDALQCATAGNIMVMCPRFDSVGAIWLDERTGLDLDAVAFAHPDMTFSVFGAEVPLPNDRFSYCSANMDDFLATPCTVAFTQTFSLDMVPTSSQLVLGPGLEGSWILPELHPEFFESHRIFWTTGV